MSTSNLQLAPHAAPYHQVPNQYYQSPPVTVHAQSSPASYYSAHLYETSVHEAHPGCPNSLDCLPSGLALEKPSQTLPILVRAAILGSTQQRLTSRDIYAAIELRFPYFKTAKENWKGSIQHNLSLNPMFAQAPRPETEPGLGSYWTVNMDIPVSKRATMPRKRPSASTASASPSPAPVPVEKVHIASTSSTTPVPDEKPAPSSSTRGRKRGRDRDGALPPAPMRRVPARAASSRKRSYAELAGEEDELDDYGAHNEEVDEKLLEKMRGKGKAKAMATRKRGRLRKAEPPPPPADETTINALIAELAETHRQHGIATALSIRLADQLTDIQADNAHERARIRRATDRAEQERQAQGAGERRIEQLRRRVVELEGWVIESGSMPQGEHIESGGMLLGEQGESNTELEAEGTSRAEGDADVISQAMSNEPMDMSGDDFGALVGGS